MPGDAAVVSPTGSRCRRDSPGTLMALRDLPIRRKLKLTSMLVSTVALMVACAGFVAFDYVSMRDGLVDEMQAHADLVASNSISAVSDKDPLAATRLSKTLAIEPAIEAAAIYTN